MFKIVNLNKDKFSLIEGAFKVLKENSTTQSARDLIVKNLEEQFKGLKFEVHVVSHTDENSFIMSVYPDRSFLDRIVEKLSGDSEHIEKIWSKIDKWVIEIDEIILHDDKFTEQELTALLLHEIGHVIYSNAITTRLSTILRYEIIKSKYAEKVMLKDRIFRLLLSIPILDSCISDKHNSSIKEEVKADKFAIKMGYSKPLLSALNKIEKMCSKNDSLVDSMKKLGNFSMQTLRDIKDRKDKIVKSNLNSLIESCNSPYMKDVLKDIYETYCVDGETREEGSKFKFLYEYADKLEEDSFYQEMFLFGKKDLKRIDPADLDYIAVQIGNIKYEGDKTMLLTYIHSKLDIIDYYLQILNNPKYSKKYNVPHSVEQLEEMRSRLYKYREDILRYKIPEIGKIVISWPSGYEG